MVRHVSIDEAQTHLPDLIDAAMSGETVLIKKGGDQAVQLVPVPLEHSASPRFGSGKGLMVMAADFDEPLAGFEEYMP